MTTSHVSIASGLRRFVPALGLATLALAVTACQREASAPGATTAARPATPVSVLVVQPQSVALQRELPGRTSASRVAEVRARINGIVLKRHFTEGANVTAGQVLFEIDPAPYQATLDSARATLARAEANLEFARIQADRYRDLINTRAVARQEFDNANATFLAAQAEVAAARAAVQSAEINLGYTSVTSPIDGRIGRAEVTEGAYVQQGTATLLAVVQQLDPLYVDLNESADNVLRLQAALASGALERNDEGEAQFRVPSPVGGEPLVGTLQFSDVTVNPGTGTVTLRGLLPNPGAALLPGMFVRAHIDEGVRPGTLLVPQAVISRNTRGDATVYVVSPENTVELRALQTERTHGDHWIVSEGLKPGDRIITDHLQKIRPGAPVQIANPAPAATAAGNADSQG